MDNAFEIGFFDAAEDLRDRGLDFAEEVIKDFENIFNPYNEPNNYVDAYTIAVKAFREGKNR